MNNTNSLNKQERKEGNRQTAKGQVIEKNKEQAQVKRNR